MRLPDLAFFLSVLFIITCLLGMIFALAARKWKLLRRLCLGFVFFISLYAILLIGVALISPQQVLAMHQMRCFDDWCASIEQVTQSPVIGQVRAKGIFYVVTVRVTSQAKRISQRALDASAFVVDEHDTRYDPSLEGQQALIATGQAGQPLNSRVDAGSSFTSTYVFDLPTNITQPGLVLSHGSFPGLIIIGDAQSFLHKPTIVRLPGN